MYVLTRMQKDLIQVYNGVCVYKDRIEWEFLWTYKAFGMQAYMFPTVEKAKTLRGNYPPGYFDGTIIVHIAYLQELLEEEAAYEAYRLDTKFNNWDSDRFIVELGTIPEPANIHLMRFIVENGKGKADYYLSQDIEVELDTLRCLMRENTNIQSGFIADVHTKLIYYSLGEANPVELAFRKDCQYYWSFNNTVMVGKDVRTD